ncbi:SHD1 domain-containing protein [Luteolibacter marinus]|uniref:SHD1 domain-containing protein n=1 Tax=Luteolibacter marinus TaxID=2776705 RepID=UPI0018685F0B|nr:SHD1 domain-containing protein [Luteolibacter marinus]
MKTRLVLVLAWACLFLAGAARADDEWRTWKSAAGTEIEAKLVSKEGNQVTLEKKDGKKLVVKTSQLSVADQEFLSAMEAPEEDLDLIIAEPGVVSAKIECAGDSKWSYFLYLPKVFKTARKWPVCLIMDPGGGSAGTLNRYIPAADRLGIILAVSVESKNGFADSDLAMMAMVKDVYDRLPVLEEMAISSGMSGGSRMAYLMAEMEENIAGVLACGSGAGVYLKEESFRPAKLRRGTVICSLIGTNDFNRREAAKSHKGFGKDARIIWFPGNHDWAGENVIMEGLADVYGKILKNSKSKELDPLRVEYAKAMLAWAKEQEKGQPWVSCHWAEFLASFPGDSAIQQEAAAFATTLGQQTDVTNARKAEKAIDDFADKYFSDGDTKGDNTPDASREKAAEKAAEPYVGLPQAEILQRMGGPSPAP